MDTYDNPICLSQYFVNKQNVRSFGNIVKSNCFKKSSIFEFYELSQNEELVSAVPANLIQILSTLKEKLREKCKHDFKEYFDTKEAVYLEPIKKEYIFTKCWQALNEIIPRFFFGCNQNIKITKNFVHNVIYSMKKQHFILNKVIQRWDFTVQPWQSLHKAKELLHHLILWIIKNVLSSIICLNFYVTTCKLDTDENKLYYFQKNQWQSFYDKQITKLVKTKVLQKFEPYSLGKKSRKNHSIASKVKFKKKIKDIPKLHLTLKPNNDCRVIVCYKNNTLTTAEKYKIKDRLTFLRTLSAKPVPKIENLYNTMYMKWVKANKPKLYFIKTDLSNAFGSINRFKLTKILAEKYMNLLKTEICVYKKKKIAQQYKDVVNELRKPILIRAGSTVYEWKEGLVQGYKYSPALSELFYSHFDSIYFSKHLKNSDDHVKLFIRVVDDYLYITDCKDDALSFLNALTNYRNVNYAKTVVNFQHDNIEFSEEITFLGYCYNTSTLQVGRSSSIYAGQMCYKISFTSGLSDMHKFIESRIGRSGIQINSHIFNLMHNNEEIIWKHIFNTFCLSANKFCTILAVLCEEKEMKEYLLLYKKKVTVKLSIAMLETLMRNKPTDYMFVYCINHFRYLSWKALYLCAKLTPKCSGLIPLIHDEIAKSNCIFSVWREHARRIDALGDCQRKAIKEVCRRHDLRMIFREFETLPPGFECYHHRRLK